MILPSARNLRARAWSSRSLRTMSAYPLQIMNTSLVSSSAIRNTSLSLYLCGNPGLRFGLVATVASGAVLGVTLRLESTLSFGGRPRGRFFSRWATKSPTCRLLVAWPGNFIYSGDI